MWLGAALAILFPAVTDSAAKYGGGEYPTNALVLLKKLILRMACICPSTQTQWGRGGVGGVARKSFLENCKDWMRFAICDQLSTWLFCEGQINLE